MATGQTDYGDYAIHLYRDHDGPVFDADGNELGTVRLTIKTPPTPEDRPPVITPEQAARAATRLKVCETCEHQKGFGNSRGLPAGVRVTVKCGKCKTCSGKSLISESSTCPMGKWTR